MESVARNLDDAGIGEVGDPDGRGLPASVVLPIGLPLEIRDVGDVRTVGREGAILGLRERQRRRENTVNRNSEKLIRVGVTETMRTEEHGLAVGSPADGDIRPGVIRQSLRLTAAAGTT